MSASSPTLARLAAPRGWLNLAAVAAVAVGVAQQDAAPSRPAILALGVVSLACWSVWAFTRRFAAERVAVAVGALASAAGVELGAPVLSAALICAVFMLLRDPAQDRRIAAAVLTAVALTIGVAALLTRQAPAATGGALVVLAFAVLMGLTRRARTAAARQEHAVLAASVDAEREAARARLLEDRHRVARDVHDVLAHSLGGLVLQLDAIEALLEHGRTADAGERVAQARRLAAEGLTEARRAVGALRHGDAATTAAPGIDDLLAAHRALGGVVEVQGSTSLSRLDPTHADAVVRVLQEALSNARRHAPGRPVLVRLEHPQSGIELRVITDGPVRAGAAGFGLIGMRERIDSLADGSTLVAHGSAVGFEVRARIAG